MISSVSNSTAAADQAQSAAAQSPTVYETPFGDVLASQITGIDLAAWVSGGSSRTDSAADTLKATHTITSTTASTATDSTSAGTSSSSAASTGSGSDVPTLESVFGSSDVWLSDPTGSGAGFSWDYNPIYFATEQTAETVAQILGGTVVQTDDITSAAGSPLQQNQANYMVELSSGAEVNAGLVADLYNHGYPQSYIDQELSEIKQQGVSAS
jgi:hypothetical protein